MLCCCYNDRKVTMAIWENKILLKDFIKSYEAGEITIVELCTKIADYLKKFPLKPNTLKGDLDLIADEFAVSETEEQFNDSLEMLYDLGDTDIDVREGVMAHKVAWIETFM